MFSVNWISCHEILEHMEKKKQPPTKTVDFVEIKELGKKWCLTVFDRTLKKIRASLYSVELIKCMWNESRIQW